jgi:hypothetical protein
VGPDLGGGLVRAGVILVALQAGLGAFWINFYQPGWAGVRRIIGNYPGNSQAAPPAGPAEVTLAGFVQSFYLGQLAFLAWASLVAIILIGLFLLARTAFAYIKQGFSALMAQFKQEQSYE